jgi:exosortase/archaeosortase family protein
MTIAVKWRPVPRTVKVFLLKAVILFVAWKFVYLVFLLPGRILDKPLTYAVSRGTVGLLNGIYRSNSYHTMAGSNVAVRFVGSIPKEYQEATMNIYLGRDRLLSIADVCNGLELMVLYAGLILCLPSPPRRKAVFIITGMLLIGILNVIRCTGLILIYEHKPEYLNFSHHYLFSFLVYAFIFLLWSLFLKETRPGKQPTLNAGIE